MGRKSLRRRKDIFFQRGIHPLYIWRQLHKKILIRTHIICIYVQKEEFLTQKEQEMLVRRKE